MKAFLTAIIYTPLYNLFIFFAWLVPGHSLGWSIIIVTLIVRGLMWKLSYKGITAPLMLRQYQDDIKAIQEKYKDDKAAQSQATLAFYKEKGVNPLSGCLPLLIQLPIIIILYRVFISGLASYHPELLYSFVPHTAAVTSHFLWLNLTKRDTLYVIPVVTALIQFAQTKHMQALNPPPQGSTDPAAMMNKQMLYLFPAMTFLIGMKLPSGLVLYWLITTIFSLGQQLYVAKNFKPTKPNVTVTVRNKNQ